MQEDNKKLVISLYEAFGRGDLAYVLSKMHHDAEWIMPGPAGLPHAGTRRGPQGAAEFFEKFLSKLDIITFEPREFIAQDARVVVLGRETLRHKTTERRCEVEWANIFTVENGLVTSFREITDTAAMATLFSG
jgi:uncharacterized protein